MKGRKGQTVRTVNSLKVYNVQNNVLRCVHVAPGRAV